MKSQRGGVKSQGEEGQRGTELHGMNNTMQPQPDEKLGQKTMVQAQTGKVPKVGGGHGNTKQMCRVHEAMVVLRRGIALPAH